jgi:hypothetical protein
MSVVQIVVFAGAVFVAAGAASAADTCKGGPKAQWKTVEQVKQAAIASGYTKVVKVILEDGCYEVVTLDTGDRIVGVQFDPVTLKLEKIEPPR